MSSQDISPPPRSIDLTQPAVPLISGHLKLGGTNPQGRIIAFNSYYMLQDGKPCIPVMGEFHFSRYAFRYWEEELLKIKAGGVNIVATYVFWNHVEEEEGVFDWSGNKNLRQFIQLCGQHQVDALVRLGPFAHGECRNGGLPDWLYGRPFRVRSNDADYLAYVRRLYHQIAAQLQGLLFKDGGPVIGVQLDNEYMHCGAPWEVTFKPGTEWVPAGFEGVEHIIRLKQLALEAGLEVPVYTCTGWLRSPIIESEILPMQGGYAFTPWSPDPNYRQEPTREYLFRNRHLHPVLNGEPTYDAARYPYVCCEIGGGIQTTYYHRPVVPPESVEALAVMNLAGGSNLIGYYMYHGGSNPVGKHSYMNEFTVPRISYDFQAPLREFGQAAESYRYLRLLHMFLKDFGDLLAPMTPTLPDDAPDITPTNTTSLRWMVRSKDAAGFIFLNNYQDHVEMQDIPDIRLHLQMPDKTLSIPQTGSLRLQKNVAAILPFGLALDGIRLRYATTQLFARIEEDSATNYFFFAPSGMSSEYVFDPTTDESLTVSSGQGVEAEAATTIRVTPGVNGVITLRNKADKTIRFFTLTREQAERSCKQTLWGQERLIISEATVVTDGEDCHIYSLGQEAISLSIYPPVEKPLTTPMGQFTESNDGYFVRYTLTLPRNEAVIEVEQIGEDRAVLHFPPDLLNSVNDVYLLITYTGDIGNAFIDGKLVSDHFYNGTPWEIGLRHFAPALPNRDLLILITPIRNDAGGTSYIPTGMAFRPNSGSEELAAIHDIRAIPEYKISIQHS